uniref:Uncharacterized protein n=1 Tax=Physcomitrium patens TaxID=3218 RepID=A0A2K1KD80_PHYPA|nr:hypothetical protein PHYPA_010897 [Physcomitrium patens]
MWWHQWHPSKREISQRISSDLSWSESRAWTNSRPLEIRLLKVVTTLPEVRG